MLPRRRRGGKAVDRSRRILIELGPRSFHLDAAEAHGIVSLPAITWLPTRQRSLAGVCWIDDHVVAVLDLSDPEAARSVPKFGLRLRKQEPAVVVGAPGTECFRVVTPADVPEDAVELNGFLSEHLPGGETP